MSGTPRYCHKCGTELPPGATFCPVCGTPVYTPPSGTSTQQPGTTPPPSSTPPPYYDRHAYKEWRREQRRNEKGEKNEKNEKDEKGGGGAIIGPIIGGAILIWLGITFYLKQIGYLTGNWWALFLVGVGIIIILQGVLIYSRHH